ncbi:Coiled-coil domain-containing protein 39 [Chytridiales sp. JEL 0842]|nr:Coiled-coil domain-containing protein 39 [Chytridiales sp. JEL 0842]
MLRFDDNHHVHSLPPFANAQNKALSRQIHEKEARLSSLTAILDDSTTRSDAMLQHLKNVKQELNHTQSLYDAKTRQIEGEDHFKQLAERESGRLAVEIKRVEKEIAETTDHLNAVQNSIYRGNERIEQIRAELKMEKDELDEWLRVQAEKEEDNLALLKYTKEDDMKIKELSLAIEKLMQEVNKKKSLLSAEVTETQVTQIELEKTTEAFKKLHVERQDLITQWENAIKTMRKRDEDISEAQERYQQMKADIAEKQKIIDEKQAFLDQQNLNNEETEKKIALCDRSVSKYRAEHSEATQSLSQFQDEVEVLRSTLNKTSNEVVNKRGEISSLKNDLQEKQGKLEKAKKNQSDVKAKLARITSDTMSMEAKAQELQEILKLEEAKSKDLDRELKFLQDQQFKKNQELFKLRQDEKNLNAEIVGGEAALKNLKSKIYKLDQEAMKQQALLYAQEFQIQQLERKVRRAQGDRTDEEKEILMKKIEELNEQLDMQTKKYNLLVNQQKKSQEDLRQAKRKLADLQKEKDSITESIDELNLYTESAGNQLNAKIKEKEELMVEENILRLELRKLRGFLNARADEVLSLEHRQVQLQLALEERTKEIGIHNDMLRLQIKNAEEERHSANSELRDRIGKVEKLRRRYEILMTQFAPEEGEEEHSQAYYVIKASQEREELQREGDELDAKIRKAEKEIKALENTLKLMNDRNEDYRMNLYKAELNANDVQHKEMLEQQYRAAMERYKAKRYEIQSMQQAIASLERTLSAQSAEEASKTQTINSKQAKILSMDRELKDQEAKRERAYKSVMKLMKEYRKAHGNQEPTDEEIDFKIRECKDLGNLVQTEISRIMELHPEITMKVVELYAENNIQPPSRPISRVPSRASSTDESDMSSRSSVAHTRSSSRTSVIGAGALNQSQSTHPHSRSSTTQLAVGGSQTPRLSMTNLNATTNLPPPHPTSSSGGALPGKRLSVGSTGNVVAVPKLPSSGTSQPASARASVMSIRDPHERNSTASMTSRAGAGSAGSSASHGPITGAKRIKKQARPGSAGSVSSQGSRASSQSGAY